MKAEGAARVNARFRDFAISDCCAGRTGSSDKFDLGRVKGE
jgi:hypothetical protein